ncbi:MAG: ArsR family transcriptional regulator, partial [Solirubrobacteraceae bacterium]|nr:ArsR family transcriptional regulator [Solirubrobacteraceae bacterium]
MEDATFGILIDARYNNCCNRRQQAMIDLPALRRLMATTALLLALAPAAAGAASAPAKLAISPAAGTPDASPATQISILGVAPAKIASVTVTGATSGAHAGRLLPYSHGRGASFVPTQSLTQGERVAVVIRIRGRSAIRYAFTVAHLDAIQPPLSLPVTQPAKLDHFVTEPDLQAPLITVNKAAPGLAGSIFLTPLPAPVVHPGSTNTVSLSPVGPGGPMIIDGRGNLVWFHQLTRPDVAANLRLQTFAGKNVLTWWQGTVTPAAFGIGEGVIADHSYRTLRTVHSGNGYGMDLHEFSLTPAGDALFTVYSPILVHLPGTPAGTESKLLDAIIQEVDVRTGLVVWEWHAYGHIPLSQSYATPANSASYDAFHINSIQPLAGGRVLASARDTSAIYDIARAGSRIVWTLGGKATDFKLGAGARFWFQHDAQMLSGNRVSLFDDGAGPPQKEPFSRGLVLSLDQRHGRATVLHSYHRSTDTSSESEGSVQTLAGGNVFAGFGATPYFSEFSVGGRLLFDGQLPQDDGSYRVFRFGWTATPTTKPVAAAQRTDASHADVYASWNGATAVARWQVLAGN